MHWILSKMVVKYIEYMRVEKSSYECKKVVSDILGEIKFVVNIKNTGKMTHFESWYKSQLKIFTFLWTKQDVKKQWNTKEIWAQNCLFPQNDKYALTTFLHSIDEMKSSESMICTLAVIEALKRNCKSMYERNRTVQYCQYCRSVNSYICSIKSKINKRY